MFSPPGLGALAAPGQLVLTVRKAAPWRPGCTVLFRTDTVFQLRTLAEIWPCSWQSCHCVGAAVAAVTRLGAFWDPHPWQGSGGFCIT